jgi:hypothetical protein
MGEIWVYWSFDKMMRCVKGSEVEVEDLINSRYEYCTVRWKVFLGDTVMCSHNETSRNYCREARGFELMFSTLKLKLKIVVELRNEEWDLGIK